MKKLVLSSILFLSIVSIFAQKDPIRFGKLDISDLEKEVYEIDSSATAIVLCEFGYLNNQTLEFSHTIRIKILKKEGLEWGDKVFPGPEKSNVRGITFNLVNGEIEKTKLKNSNVFRERITDDYYQLRVAMPNVKVGSIIDIEFSYFGIPNNWYFQREIPVLHSELRIEQSPYIDFRKNSYGFEPIKNIKDWIWLAENVPAFKEEPYISSEENYITKFEFDILSIHFGTYYKGFTTSWDAVAKIINESDYFAYDDGGYFFLNSIADEIESKTSDQMERIKLAYEAIQNNVKWNEKERLFTTYPGISKPFSEKIGNSADINLMLVNLLLKLDISAYPVLMSTRSNGFLPFYPTLEKLNYVIAYVKVNDEILLLDATDQYIPVGMLPPRCLNIHGRICNKQTTQPVNLKTDAIDHETAFYNLTLDENNILKGDVGFLQKEYAAYDFRKGYHSYNSEEEFIQDIESYNNGLRIVDYTIENTDSIYKDIKENYMVEISNQVESIGDKLYINPLLYEKVTENEFNAETRKYPIDFIYPRKKYVTINYTLPENYTVESVPKPVMMKLPNDGGSFRYQAFSSGNVIKVVYRLDIHKTMFTENEYEILKEFYNQLITKHAEPIVLKSL